MKECSYIVRDLGYLLALLPEFSPKAKFFEEPRESNATVAKHLWGTSPIHAPPRPGSEPPQGAAQNFANNNGHRARGRTDQHWY